MHKSPGDPGWMDYPVTERHRRYTTDAEAAIGTLPLLPDGLVLTVSGTVEVIGDLRSVFFGKKYSTCFTVVYRMKAMWGGR